MAGQFLPYVPTSKRKVGDLCPQTDPEGPQGVCGHPVESEPCPQHGPQHGREAS